MRANMQMAIGRSVVYRRRAVTAAAGHIQDPVTALYVHCSVDRLDSQLTLCSGLPQTEFCARNCAVYE